MHVSTCRCMVMNVLIKHLSRMHARTLYVIPLTFRLSSRSELKVSLSTSQAGDLSSCTCRFSLCTSRYRSVTSTFRSVHIPLQVCDVNVSVHAHPATGPWRQRFSPCTSHYRSVTSTFQSVHIPLQVGDVNVPVCAQLATGLWRQRFQCTFNCYECYSISQKRIYWFPLYTDSPLLFPFHLAGDDSSSSSTKL